LRSEIKFSTAKCILSTYRKEGRVGKKKYRERKISSHESDCEESEVEFNKYVKKNKKEEICEMKNEQTS